MKAKRCLGALLFALTSASGAADRLLETRVLWSPQCANEPVTEGVQARSVFLGAVVAAVAPKLIGGAIDSAATALKKAGERAEMARSTGRAVTRPYGVTPEADLALTPEHGCLIVARGDFSGVGAKGGTTSLLTPWAKDGGAGLVMLLQLKIKPLGGEPYFQLVPYQFRVGSFEDTSSWSKQREYTVAVTLSAPGAEKPFASTTFTFPGVAEGQNYIEGSWQLAGKASAPMALPAPPDAGKKAQAKQEAFVAPYVTAAAVLTAINKPPPTPATPVPNPRAGTEVIKAIGALCKTVRDYNSEFPKAPTSDPYCANSIALARAVVDQQVEVARSPKTLQAWALGVCPNPKGGTDGSVTCNANGDPPIAPDARFGYMVTDVTTVEARPGNRFAAYLGEALGAAKDDLTKAVAAQVVPSQVKAAQEAEDTADRNARRGVVLADLAVTQAEQALAELLATQPRPSESSITVARAALIKAKIAANDAYRAANLPVPYPDLD